MAARTKPGDAFVLSKNHKVSELDLSLISNGVEISGEGADIIHLDGHHDNMVISGTNAFLHIGSPPQLAKASSERSSALLSNSLVKDITGARGGFNTVTFVNIALLSDTKRLQIRAHGVVNYNFVADPFINCVILYFDALGVTKSHSAPFMKITNGDNSRIAHVLQANYCRATSLGEMEFLNSKNMAILSGDSEGSKATTWVFSNCENMLLAGQRVFHSHGGAHGCTGGPQSILLANCKSFKLLHSQDIGDPTLNSLKSTGSDLQIWGGFWEDPISITSDALQVFNTVDGFNGQLVKKWAEPVYTGNEVTASYQGKDFTDPAIASGNTFPVPPDVPVLGMNRFGLSKLKALERASFGKALLAAGADPTGKLPSDEAFAKVLQSEDDIEVPAGIFRLEKPLVLGSIQIARDGLYKGRMVANRRSISGQGMNKTRLIASSPDMAVIKAGYSPEYLARIGALNDAVPLDVTGGADQTIKDLTLSGGWTGIDATCTYFRGSRIENVKFENQTEACFKGGSRHYDKADNDQCGSYEFDQNRWLGCVFDGTNTANYGVHVNMNMIDKNMYYGCTFQNLKKAGIAYNFSNHENTSVVECTFKNIDGPGVDYWPINYGTRNVGGDDHLNPGYTPTAQYIESCLFENCGNTTRPAIDFNWSESGIIANTTIKITKPWIYGFLGTANAMVNIVIDVDGSKMVSGGAAVALRANYQAKNSRTNGNILRNVMGPDNSVISAPIKWLNDSKGSYIDGIQTNVAMENYFKIGSTWTNWTAFAENTWAFPTLLYGTKFQNRSDCYTLLRTDRSGSIQKEITLKPSVACDFETRIGPDQAKHMIKAPLSPDGWRLYDISGRQMKIKQSAIVPEKINSYRLPKGRYLLKHDMETNSRPVLVF